MESVRNIGASPETSQRYWPVVEKSALSKTTSLSVDNSDWKKLNKISDANFVYCTLSQMLPYVAMPCLLDKSKQLLKYFKFLFGKLLNLCTAFQVHTVEQSVKIWPY